jgi:hypothetical protein
LHWNIATADRNIANSLKGFAKSFSNCKANEEKFLMSYEVKRGTLHVVYL